MMKLRVGLAIVLLCGMMGATATAHAQSAGAWDKKGASAEARDDWDGAFEAYRQAHLKSPKDLRYKTHYERMRYQAANAHVDRGRVLRQSGDTDGAITEFSRALQIDPGNQAASQELEQTTKPKVPPGMAGSGVPLTPLGNEQTPYQRQVQKDILSLGGPVTLQPVSDDPITLSMVEDTKVIYQAIGKAAGLNVIFDPEYTSKRIPVNLNSVSLGDALRIVGTLSGTFWKPVTPNTLFVAQNNRTKRTELDDLATQTFYLTNVSQQNDANEILVALRNLMEPTVKIFLVASQNAIVLRATPDELLLAEKLINDLDRTRPEVVIDVAVLEVSRDKIRNLGITLPTSFGLTPTPPTTNATTGTTSTTGTSTTGTTGSNLTLNQLANINATDFAVTVSGGTVNALLSDSDTRILQNPRIRATDGQRAQLKIGSKIPVATGSYNAGVSTGIASVGVQTQFTYLDVGVNIDLTPTVHYDREISMKMHIEVSSQNGSVTISNVTEPIIAQKVADQVIQVKDGEPSLLAGILTKEDTKSVSGTPGLGEIPFLKYFFSSQQKEQQSDEIVFLVIPHIVREAVLTDVNTRAFYTGTGASIDFIRKTPDQIRAAVPVAGTSIPAATMQPTTAANAASSMITKIAADGQAIAPPSIGNPAAEAANAAVSVPGGPVQLNMVPATNSQPVGSTFQVAVMLSNANDLYSVPLQIQFNSKVLSLVNVDAGNLLSKDGQAVALVHRDEGDGAVAISASRPPGVSGVSGSGTVCTLTFKAIGPGDSPLQMVRIGAKDSKQNSLPAVGSPATVHVQ